MYIGTTSKSALLLLSARFQSSRHPSPLSYLSEKETKMEKKWKFNSLSLTFANPQAKSAHTHKQEYLSFSRLSRFACFSLSSLSSFSLAPYSLIFFLGRGFLLRKVYLSRLILRYFVCSFSAFVRAVISSKNLSLSALSCEILSKSEMMMLFFFPSSFLESEFLLFSFP
jgi:hypothetical protein